MRSEKDYSIIERGIAQRGCAPPLLSLSVSGFPAFRGFSYPADIHFGEEKAILEVFVDYRFVN